MRYNILYISFIFISFFSCNSPSTHTKSLASPITYQWNLESKNALSSLIKNVKYIPLEITSESLFKDIDKFIKLNNKYFLFDCFGKNQVIVFDSCGKFLFNVGRKGHGPGEYLRIRNFAVDSQYIYLLNNDQHTLMIYDQNGKYIKDKKLSFIAFDLATCQNGHFLFSWHQNIGGTNNKELYKILITDPDLNIQHHLLKIDGNDCNNMSKRYYFTTTNKYIIFHNLFNDDITLFHRKSGEIANTYTIHLGSNMIPENKRNNYESVSDYTYLSSTPFIFSSYITGQVISDKQNQLFLYDINTQTTYKNLNNDSLFIFPPLYCENNEITSYLFSYKWYEYMKNKGISPLPKDIENKLEKGHCILIKYILK